MDQALDVIKGFAIKRYEEDYVDRLNFQISSMFLVIASGLISYKAYFGGSALACWTPQQFRKGWDEYVNDFCFVENTYYTTTTEYILPNTTMRGDKQLPYYQWVPFMLVLQAMMFCAPHVLWRMVNWMSGVQVRAVVAMASHSINYGKSKFDDKKLAMVANHLHFGLRMSRGKYKNRLISNPVAFTLNFVTRRLACYITCCYLSMKTLFIVNLLLQLALINFFLDIPDASTLTWGLTLIWKLSSGSAWMTTKIFPRVTVCDFQVRELGNLHNWSVQCVLPVNMFNEKIYVVLWWWIHFVLIITIANTVTWMINLLSAKRRETFLEGLVNDGRVMHKDVFDEQYTTGYIAQQLYNDLGWDGVLILRIIKANAGEFPCVEIVTHIYNNHLRQMSDESYDESSGRESPKKFPRLNNNNIESDAKM